MTLCFYISGHGFGHAARVLEVIGAILERRPDIRIVVRSSVPRWFLDARGLRPLEIEPLEADVGMVQLDSLRIDEDATAELAARFYQDFARRASDEASVLRRLGASLVVGDIPPLAFAAAAEAGIPSVALGNFTWDWIYAGYPQFESIAPGVVDLIAGAYENATVALRLPFHGGFATMRKVQELPLIARRADHSRAEVRGILQLDGGRPVVLASFGGHGLALPYADIARQGRFTLIVTDHESDARGPQPAALKRFTSHDLRGHGLRYADLVAASDVVVTKPGYGIVSECIANGTALLYASRGRFVEYDVFVAEMPKALRCREIPQSDLLAGRWSEHVEALLDQDEAPGHMPTDGADVAAAAILEIARSDA